MQKSKKFIIEDKQGNNMYPATFADVVFTEDGGNVAEKLKQIEGATPNAHTHTKSQITDFPTSLPANGGNADTVGGKRAGDFLPKQHPVLDTNLTLNSSIIMNGIRTVAWNAGREEQSSIYWNADTTNDFGLTFEVGGVQQLILEKDNHPKIKIKGQWKTLNSSDNTEMFYTDLNGILDEAQTSETDLASNLYTIINTIPMYAKVKMFISDTSRPKLYKCIKAKCEADGITGIPVDFIMCIEKANNTNLPNKVMIWDNQKYREIVFFYDRSGSDNKLSKAGITFNNGLGGGGVKSIQRGFFETSFSSSSQPEKVISLSTVNPAKCSVILNGNVITNANNYVGLPVVKKLEATKLTLGLARADFNENGRISWEVVEYA